MMNRQNGIDTLPKYSIANAVCRFQRGSAARDCCGFNDCDCDDDETEVDAGGDGDNLCEPEQEQYEDVEVQEEEEQQEQAALLSAPTPGGGITDVKKSGDSTASLSSSSPLPPISVISIPDSCLSAFLLYFLKK